MKYDHKKIERKWQKKWVANGLYRTEQDSKKPKSYVLDMFPYPSSEGLHVGHPKGYIATDIYSRMKRMQGHNVLHPMGWDAFGLPAENFAIKNKVHPRKAVEKNIARFKEQLEKIGFNYDWNREINTTDPEYYKWTQWIFLKLFEKGLAYQSNEPINWCPSCQTGLSNEDLDEGACERCGSIVEKRPMRQWMLKITDYAERLLKDLDLLPQWPEYIKESQRNWIGKSEGALIDFFISGKTDGIEKITVFTTRPDTLFGVTYIAISPELAKKWMDIGWKPNFAVLPYMGAVLEERVKLGVEVVKEKTGMNTGIFAINPVNKEKIPVWVANYVLGDVGTGAIMAVPAHDERDYEFAKKYDLPIRTVVEPCFIQKTEPGAVRSELPFVEREAITAIVKHWSEDKYIGLRWKKVDWETLITGGVEAGQTPVEATIAEITEETGYQHMRFVRELPRTHAKFFHVPKNQNRFAHFHVLYFELENGVQEKLTDEEKANHELIWLTPQEMEKFRLPESHRYSWKSLHGAARAYSGDGILSNSGEFDGMESEEAKRAITTFVGGKWTTTYRLKDWVFSRQRYWGEPIPIIHCEKCGAVPVPEKDLPVMLPKVEHYEPTGTGESPLAAISEWVNTECPKCGGAGKRETNTMPQWAGSSWYYLRYMDPENDTALVSHKREKYWAPVDVYVGGAEHATRHLIYARFWHKFLQDIGVVSASEPFERLISVGLIMAEDGKKMSKRYGNVINPDDVVETWGADTLRLYEMFMGPFTDTIAWNSENMIGVQRFLERVWRLAECVSADDVAVIERELNKTIKKVSEDIEQFKFNTAISQMMIFLNMAEKERTIGRGQWEMFLKVLAPFAPHVTEELWHKLDRDDSVHIATWPPYDDAKLFAESVTIAVQVNGKIRGTVTIPIRTQETEVALVAKKAVSKWIEGKEITRTVFVRDRLVNFVLK